jgi:hypothetical protein
MGTTFENLLRTWAGTSHGRDRANDGQRVPTDTSTMFHSGQLDDDLFNIANTLRKGGANPERIKKTLEVLAEYGNKYRGSEPPFTIKDIETKVQSALSREEREKRNLSQEIRDWVSVAPGVFYTRDMARDLDINSKNDQKTASGILIKMVKEGILEGSGKRGVYRIKEVGFEEMDFDIPEAKTISLSWPLKIEELYRCYPGTVAVLAGAPESGKTTYCLNYCLQNMNKHNVTYLSSELWGPELKSRILLFNRGTEVWKRAKFKKVVSNFEDAIDPDGINIVDYIKIYDEFWLVAKAMQSISNRLRSGTALIALQRQYAKEVAKGGEGTLEDPRLYLTMNRVKGEDFAKIKILKCHNWIDPTINPNRMYKNFKIIKGHRIEEISSEWKPDEEREESAYDKTARGR